MKILFLCKKRGSAPGHSTGLFNSASFISKTLNECGVESKVKVVIDNNSIDKEVSLYHPSHVFIEAFWVIPEKFNILCSLHPNVKWVVRSHSKIPFFANEGIAMEWMWGYIEIAKKFKNFRISYNEFNTVNEVESAFKYPIDYLPNIYNSFYQSCIKEDKKRKEHIDIGCFGAIRPMKNHLIQAFASINFARNLNMKLRFHINGERVEQKGDEVLKNLRNLFAPLSDCKLIEHKWLPYQDFIEVIRDMDFGMQVSLTESFNIITADFVSNDIPIVVSPDIRWVSSLNYANPNDMQSIVESLWRVRWMNKIGLGLLNKFYLWDYNKEAKKIWLKYLKG